MIRRGYMPQPPVTIVTENGDEAMIAQVRTTAEQALATGQNAQQMVRNRDARLAGVEESTLTLQQLADEYRGLAAESAEDRAALHTQHDDLAAAVAALASAIHDESHDRADGDAMHQVAISGLRAQLDAIQLTPGPAGRDGKDGAPGAVGTPGAPGAPGADGRSAYQIARDKGYGGTETQWLATLKGDAGATGPAGKDADIAVITALAARVTALETTSKPFGFGLAPTPTLSLLSTTDITVPLSREMPDTAYIIELSKPAGIRDDMITLKTKTRTSVTYTVRAVIAITVTGMLGVIARY